MALTLERALLVRQRTLGFTRKPKIQGALKWFWSYLDQHLRDRDLQIVFFAALDGTDVVVADAACKVYCVYIKKPAASTTDAYFKASDHASTLAETAPEHNIRLAAAAEEIIIFYDGAAMTNGYTIGSNTTSGGSTTSATADKSNGFVIIGAP